MPDLFSPLKIGSVEAKNRIIMSPMTRARATKEGVPTDMMVTYYEQRADAGLIITEAVGVNQAGLGWPYAPGIWNETQTEKWAEVVKAVHAKGGKIALQLWHMGRAAHSNVSGTQPVSSSATVFPYQIHTYEGKKDAERAHEMTIPEIKQTIQDYHNAAKNAINAGFDAVEIHGANGYLVDQFLRDSSNTRTDEYGGSMEKRMRFLDELVDSVIAAVGKERTFIRLSPNGDTQGVSDSNNRELFLKVTELLQSKDIAMLELREMDSKADFFEPSDQPKLHGPIREIFKNTLVINQQFTADKATEFVKNEIADAISFGRPFIANPDLVSKIRNNQPWRVAEAKDAAKWLYAQGPEGYIDYPTGTN